MLSTSSIYRPSIARSWAAPICASIKSSLICRTSIMAHYLPIDLLPRADSTTAKRRSQQGELDRNWQSFARNDFPGSFRAYVNARRVRGHVLSERKRTSAAIKWAGGGRGQSAAHLIPGV